MTETVKLIYTELGENSNKMWEATLDGSAVTYAWGRIGNDSHQSKTMQFPDEWAARKHFEKKRAEKEKKGYTLQRTEGATTGGPVSSRNLEAIARAQIVGAQDPEVQKLVDFLVQRNVHAIQGATDVKFNSATGQLTTPLGVVTTDGLDDADALLDSIALVLDESQLDRLVNRYLRIVPMKIHHRGTTAHDLFPDAEAVKRQKDLVAAMRSVVNTAVTSDAAPQVFKTTLAPVPSTDPEFARIRKFFEAGRNRNHTSYGMKLKRVFRVEVAGAEEAFERDGAKIGNVKQLWHGTQDSNLLSMLKSGYVIPRRGGTARITGRMYGDGVYFSDQSTKSLNYASGYWGQRSQRCFMLLNDVAMGREYPARSSFSGGCKPGYDSTFAGAGRSGVMNNEMIVYRTSQIRPRYLCEFE